MLRTGSDLQEVLICKVKGCTDIVFCEHLFICMITIIQNLQFSFLRSCDLTQPLIMPRRLYKRHNRIRASMLQVGLFSQFPAL